MKFLILFGVCAVGQVIGHNGMTHDEGKKVHLTPDQSAKVLTNAMQCVIDKGLSPDVVMQVKDGKFGDDQKFKEFMFCTFKKSGLVNKDGNLNIGTALKKFPSDKGVDKAAVKVVLEKCAEEAGENPADKAFNIFKCYRANTPIHVSLF